MSSPRVAPTNLVTSVRDPGGPRWRGTAETAGPAGRPPPSTPTAPAPMVAQGPRPRPRPPRPAVTGGWAGSGPNRGPGRRRGFGGARSPARLHRAGSGGTSNPLVSVRLKPFPAETQDTLGEVQTFKGRYFPPFLF